MERFSVGFVYVLSNRAMPGFLKIGMAEKQLASDRAEQLFTTSLPLPFDIEYQVVTSHPHAVERGAHRLLADHRRNPRREFFSDIEVCEAIAAIEEARIEAAGLQAWAGTPVHYVRHRDRLALTLRAGEIVAVLAYPSLYGRNEIIDIWQAHTDGDMLELYGTQDPAYVAGLSDGDPGGDTDVVPYLDRKDRYLNAHINGRERLMPGDRLVWVGAGDTAGTGTHALFEMRDYCQAVSRVETVQLDPGGMPLTLNDLTYNPPVWMHKPIRDALDLPLPRNWAPRDRSDTKDWTRVAGQSPHSDYWLTQLQERKRHRDILL